MGIDVEVGAAFTDIEEAADMEAVMDVEVVTKLALWERKILLHFVCSSRQHFAADIVVETSRDY